MKVLKRILQQILTFSVTLPHPNNSFKYSSMQTTSLVLASQSVSKAHQHRLLHIPHKKSTSLQGIKKKDCVVVNELDEYFKLPREDFDTCEPLNWWRGRRSQFPTLY